MCLHRITLSSSVRLRIDEHATAQSHPRSARNAVLHLTRGVAGGERLGAGEDAALRAGDGCEVRVHPASMGKRRRLASRPTH